MVARGQAHVLSHRRRHAAAMLPLDLIVALAPLLLWLALRVVLDDEG
jgi:hypothetical protein